MQKIWFWGIKDILKFCLGNIWVASKGDSSFTWIMITRECTKFNTNSQNFCFSKNKNFVIMRHLFQFEGFSIDYTCLYAASFWVPFDYRCLNFWNTSRSFIWVSYFVIILKMNNGCSFEFLALFGLGWVKLWFFVNNCFSTNGINTKLSDFCFLLF